MTGWMVFFVSVLIGGVLGLIAAQILIKRIDRYVEWQVQQRLNKQRTEKANEAELDPYYKSPSEYR